MRTSVTNLLRTFRKVVYLVVKGACNYGIRVGDEGRVWTASSPHHREGLGEIIFFHLRIFAGGPVVPLRLPHDGTSTMTGLFGRNVKIRSKIYAIWTPNC